ncbi:TRAP transporter large permease [Burkholderia multivorans]|uniref:TRAP transporter large permease n=1 Tax=Burkholderia multivorans TaxID=87883 RepID=UPI0019D183C0|nr:TRAP transporter large permease [Burkholderia multivorans]MBN6731241.1 TRAP transporter large permease [Burkholderia multivorans]MBN6733489.1 TRAP transporter large permease [Burkholderia multivorans]MBN7130587.1 TRAP transporter large permease [Burkholderia multivorans]MBN8165055.1 TRAP transporter large permease [Burkholderia multivorans]MBN8170844.1 TRAP transporter large permease [Burkholderia multivorans]
MTLAMMGFFAVLLLAFIGVPLGFAMLGIGVSFFAVIRGWEPALAMAGMTIADLAANENLSVLPMFILMGTFIYKADLAEELYDAANAWIGHLKGGLAHATVLACAGFASMSGSSIATAATMTKVAMPPMRRHRYADSLAAGCVSSGGTLGALIPPSFPLLIYGVLTDQDIGKLFIAGIGPGILLGALFLLSIWWTVRRDPTKGPCGERVDWPTRFRKLGKIWGVLALFMLVVGGLYSGIFTATEASSIGATGALAFAGLRRKLSLPLLFDSLVDAGKTTAMIFAIAFGGMVFSNFITLSGLTATLVAWIHALHLPLLGVIAVITCIYIVLGSLMEALAMMLLTIPVFAAIVQPLGANMIWFGIYVAMMMEIGMIHPPVGMNVFMVKTMLPDLSIRTIFRGTIPFLIANVVALVVVILVPGIALGLVSLMR